MKTLKLVLFLAAFFTVGPALAQCDSLANLCGKNISSEFISDGQQYRALLLNDEVAEFRLTMFGGTTYRLAACSRIGKRNLLFRVYDQERNLLFSNADHHNAVYWDFQVTNTLDCIVEAQLDPDYSASSGCAILLVGFKQ